MFSRAFFRALVVALYALCALLVSEAALMAIDYGNDWFKVALVKPGNPPIDIVLNRDSKRKTQSLLTIRDGVRFYGTDAFNLGTRFHMNTYFALKRVIGRSFDDNCAQEYRATFPNNMTKDSNRNSIVFQYNETTTFTVEELVAMQFAHAKEQAEAAAQEAVRDVVIAVPPFYNQYERRAVLDAAALADLNVMSLINDETAVALNYATQRLSAFTEETQYHIFYDMGAGSTVASVIGFKIADEKDVGRFNKSVVHVDVKSVGYDRTLGGQAFDLRLQRHLATEFEKKYAGKLKSSVFSSDRAMMKLLKEANRVKQILSANSETFASIENLHENFDFRIEVTRAAFDSMVADLLKRVHVPVQTALQDAGMTTNDVKTLVLVGGGIRVPAVQAVIKDIVGEDKIAQNVNGDEAAAMGAAFRAATLSHQYRVKEMKIKDLTPYPIEVVYSAEPKETSDGLVPGKVYNTTLFNTNSALGIRKIMTFKHKSDFDFTVKYGEQPEVIKESGAVDIATARVTGLSDAIKKFSDVTIEQPKVKVTLQLDDSGIVSVAEAIATIATDSKPSLKDTLKSFFGVQSNTTEETVMDAPIPESASSDMPSTPTTRDESASPSVNSTEPSSKEPIVETIKLDVAVEYVGIKPLSPAEKVAAAKRLRDMDHADQLRRAREAAHNELEAHVYRAHEFLHDEVVLKVSTEEQRKQLSLKLSETSDWIYERGDVASTEELRARIDGLWSLQKPISFRRDEHQQRPEAISNVRMLLDTAREFINHVRTNVDAKNRLHTEEELDRIVAMTDLTDRRLQQMVDDLEKSPLWADSAITTSDIRKVGADLQSELIKLVARKPPKRPKVSTAESTSEETSATSTQEEKSKQTPKHDEL